MRAYMVIASSTAIIVSVCCLIYGFRHGSIFLLNKYGSSGMKDRVKQPLMYWLGVFEWGVIGIVGAVLLLSAFVPDR